MGNIGRLTRVAAGAVLLLGSVVAFTGSSSATPATDDASLRAAFGDANETTIDINQDISISNCGAGALSRNSATAIVVNGHGHTLTQTCDADVFDQSSNGAITINDLTVVMTGSNNDGFSTSGDVTLNNSSIGPVADGDGVSSGGLVTLTSSRITGVVDGDGISSESTSLTDSEVVGAVTEGCSAISTGDATLVRSTVIGCDDGISTGSATLTNSTVTGATSDGVSAGSVVLVFSTIVGNAENISSGTLESTGSVVAKATGGPNCSTETTSHGDNWDDDGSCGFDQSSDHSDAGDPGLGAIGANGGLTDTMLPQAGSGLIDAAGATCAVSVDQRGTSRPQGPACDIGAVEVAVSGPTTTTTTTTPPTTAPGAAQAVTAEPNLTG